MFPKYNDWEYKYTKIGLVKKRIKAVLKLAAVTLAIIGTYRVRQARLGLRSVNDVALILRATMSSLLHAGGDALQKVAGLL